MRKFNRSRFLLLSSNNFRFFKKNDKIDEFSNSYINVVDIFVFSFQNKNVFVFEYFDNYDVYDIDNERFFDKKFQKIVFIVEKKTKIEKIKFVNFLNNEN